MDHVGTNVRGLVSTNKWLYRGSESDSCRQRPVVSITNLHHRKLECDSESLGLLALVSVLRVGVHRLVAASFFLISSSTVCMYVCMYVCVCVFFPSILDINGRTSRGHTGGRSHRIFNPPSFCGACLDFLSREGFSHSFPSSTVKSNFVY